ncbi:MAG: SRPBCC domain-containing protein [Proteobacteria bacterium]|nr:SRPBCC domain-containing protein [Pseudomonadota bacterium]
MKQTVANDNAVVFECELPEPRAKVWRALTERELLAAWLLPAPVECEVLETEPGRRLRWRQLETADAVSPRHFIESVVSFELADTQNGGTHLRVVHDGFTTVTRCSTVVAFRPRAKAAVTPTSAVLCCSLRRAA